MLSHCQLNVNVRVVALVVRACRPTFEVDIDEDRDIERVAEWYDQRRVGAGHGRDANGLLLLGQRAAASHVELDLTKLNNNMTSYVTFNMICLIYEYVVFYYAVSVISKS